MTVRIGSGFDAHAFDEAGDGFMLGGVHVPFERGVKAHSDGDVLLHALCDAILGAAGLNDLGEHFPSDGRHRGVAGRDLLRRTLALAGKTGLRVVNADMTVVAEAPRLSPFIPQIRPLIACDLQIPSDCVNVKVTSTDGLGFVGRGEGIAAFAVVLMSPGE